MLTQRRRGGGGKLARPVLLLREEEAGRDGNERAECKAGEGAEKHGCALSPAQALPGATGGFSTWPPKPLRIALSTFSA